ncbi:MAG: acyl-CoA dehydrogenase family protein, partial [Stackebrandtia sp.]
EPYSARGYPDVEMDWYGAPGGEFAPGTALSEGGFPGSEPDAVGRVLFDERGTDIAILHPMTRGIMPDRHLGTAIASAHNEMMISRWLESGTYAEHYRGTLRVNPEDIAGALREIERWGAHPGIVALGIPMQSRELYGKPQFWPLWEAAADAHLPVAVHIESGSGVAATVPVEAVRTLSESTAGFEHDWWRRGAELGWTAPLVPEKLGGGSISGMPMADLALVAEEFGRACAPGPLITVNAALTGLLGGAVDLGATIGEIVAGETIVVWAHYEPGAGVCPAEFGTLATPEGDGFRISGTKDRVEFGARADLLLVDAQGPRGPVQLLIAADAPGVTVTPTWTLDVVRRTATVAFDNVAVAGRAVVQCDPDAARIAIETQLLVAATLSASEMSGAAQHAFDITLQWMTDRYTFGRPLASYQALKHRAADAATTLEACRATSWAAASSFGGDIHATAEAVSVAKSFVGATTGDIMQECVQIHGGLGVTWEHDMHLYLRRVT